MAKKILVVDDDAETVDLLKFLLEKEDYEVFTAYNGEECLKKLRESEIDLVLLDIMMPGMDGREVFKKITEGYKNTRVMFLTVIKSTNKEKEVFFKKGLVNYILKPFDSKELLDQIRLDELKRLEKETEQLGHMIELSRVKYHKRKIDRESYREIVRDYQKKQIECEVEIKSLKKKGI